MSEILVVGSINMDLLARVDTFPVSGETITAKDFQMAPGGKGANQATAIARLGGPVAMIGKVGKDVFGQALMGKLRDHGVSVKGVSEDEREPTGLALVVVDFKGENRIVFVPGANSSLRPDEVRKHQNLFSRAKLLVLQLELPSATVEAAAHMGRDLTVLLNAAPVSRAEDCSDVLELTDVLVVNEIEAATLSGTDIANRDDAKEAGTRLLGFGPSAVVITLGADGAILVEAGHAHHVPAFKVKAVDTTGAGDAFMGGLARSIWQGRDVLESVKFANSVAAIAVTKAGAQTSLPTMEAVVESFPD